MFFESSKIYLAAFCLLAMAFRIQAADYRQQPLMCWHCSSDTIGAEDFCDEDFSEGSIPTDLVRERNISLVRPCNSSINSEHERAVCRKTVEEINGKLITKRFCYYTNKSDTTKKCNEQVTEKNVIRMFCEDCLEDKCNTGVKQTFWLAITLFLPMLLMVKAYLN